MVQGDFPRIPGWQSLEDYLEITVGSEAKQLVLTTVQTFSTQALGLMASRGIQLHAGSAFYYGLAGLVSNALLMSANSLQGVCENGHQLQYLREDDKLYLTCPCGRWLVQDLVKQ